MQAPKTSSSSATFHLFSDGFPPINIATYISNIYGGVIQDGRRSKPHVQFPLDRFITPSVRHQRPMTHRTSIDFGEFQMNPAYTQQLDTNRNSKSICDLSSDPVLTVFPFHLNSNLSRQVYNYNPYFTKEETGTQTKKTC